MPDIRYCTINPNGGGLSVTMTADSGLRAGGRFGLYDTSRHLQEDWSVATGDDGEGEFFSLNPLFYSWKRGQSPKRAEIDEFPQAKQ